MRIEQLQIETRTNENVDPGAGLFRESRKAIRQSFSEVSEHAAPFCEHIAQLAFRSAQLHAMSARGARKPEFLPFPRLIVTVEDGVLAVHRLSVIGARRVRGLICHRHMISPCCGV